MSKRRIAAYLLFGVVTGLVLTACAGVATGTIDLPGTTEVVTLGPAVDVQSDLTLEIARPANSAQFLFEKARTAELQATGLLQEQGMMQAQHSGPFCSRGGH